MSDLDDDLNNPKDTKTIRFKKLAPGVRKQTSRKPKLSFDDENEEDAGIKQATKVPKPGFKGGSAPVTVVGEAGLKLSYTRKISADENAESQQSVDTPKVKSTNKNEEIHPSITRNIDPLTGLPIDSEDHQKDVKQEESSHPSNIHSIHSFKADTENIPIHDDDEEEIEDGKNELIMTLDDAFVEDGPLGLTGEPAPFTVDANMYDLELGSPAPSETISNGENELPGKSNVLREKPPDLQLQIDALRQSIATLKTDQSQAEKDFSEVKAQLDQISDQKSKLADTLKDI
ncbi:hypothetical protein QFC19_008886 [Naganishia cerealis]|uniref:Uncharacterized protein n=1 Tax=Naganishia cerealis TaxID=610337 RepID=A0ACC2UYB2_9TREE|nr:hypothetical protein QFC19_008886 [Naganishia cerealis]